CFRIPARALVLLPELEIAKTGQLDLLATFQGTAQRLEQGVDEFLGFPLVQPDVLEQAIGHHGLGERCRHSPYPRSSAWNALVSACTAAVTAESASSSVRVREGCRKIKPMAMLFNPSGKPLPRYSSKTTRSSRSPPTDSRTAAAMAAYGTLSPTRTAMSRRTCG